MIGKTIRMRWWDASLPLNYVQTKRDVRSDTVRDASKLSEPAQLAEINRRHRKHYARDQAGGEGELRCTFPKGIVASIEGDDEVLHVNGRKDTIATFHGWHEARKQDDGSTSIHFMGEKPSALVQRQPEPAQDALRRGIVAGAAHDTTANAIERLRALNARNRQHDWSRHGRQS